MGHQRHAIGIVDQRISGNTGLFLVGFTEAAVNDQQLAAAAHRRFPFDEAHRHMTVDDMGAFTVQAKFLQDTKYYINPTGRFVVGSSFADSGLTGRKIIADTYGGMCRHGGGAFSGKDPTKVDRSGAYMARKIAKDLVRSGQVRKCEVQLAYAIGVAEPVSVAVECFGTERISLGEIKDWIRANYDLTPAGIIKELGLLDVDYNQVSAYGHFGKAGLPWEE